MMLDKKYEHKKIESKYYQNWIKEGYFTAGDVSKKPYCMVIPPPNVTGKLHLGHAWDNTIQDIIARYKRLQGFDVLWVSGMDHAGIATQAKVDERLKEAGISRYDLGREKFLEKAWEWKEEYATHIREQWSVLGLSLDYSRERFTLDDGLSEAVKKVFIDLYNDGLIYQGERIINWDPQAKTALSNIEVEHKEVEGAMYYFKYQVVDSDQQLIIATTRPETMFADQAVFVHPDDLRYRDIIGKSVINPATQQAIPIMADDYIDMEFGTAVMKCTPAHDPNDFVLAKKYDLAMPICMHPDGTMNEMAHKYEGMDRFACRKALIEDFKAAGVVEKIDVHMHQVGHSQRTGVIVEPYLSKQWFVSMKPLAKEVLAAQLEEEERINFYPKRFEKTFTQWLENIEDWCISRQLWWGHRIPAYYHKDTNEIYVGDTAPVDIENYYQDEDVLDTWFSSALWPFSTLGWPNESDDFDRYFPNDSLSTGYDIIFFWVARMAFQARYCTKQRPFKDVLIHGLIRDPQGRKMSKSLGNGVDPIEVVDKFGCDALRFFLTTNSTPGQDMRFIEEKVESSSNFINKVYNASKYVMMNIEGFDIKQSDFTHMTFIDQWIMDKLNTTITNVSMNMDRYEFALAGNELYDFIWNDFCNWYIELSKISLQSKDTQVKLATQSVLYHVLVSIIKMLHPYMPFVSEEIYLALPHTKASINLESYPVVMETNFTVEERKVVEHLLTLVGVAREVKAEYNMKPSAEIEMIIKNINNEIITLHPLASELLTKIAKVNIILEDKQEEMVVRAIEQGSVHIPMSELIDIESEKINLTNEKAKLEGEIKRGEQMLANPNFVNKAPAQKVDAEKEKLENYKKQYQIVVDRLVQIG